MNLKVAYQPFANDAKLLQMNSELVHNHNLMHIFDRFNPKIIISGENVLRPVYRFQQLYIMAHCFKGADGVTDSAGNFLSVEALARQLLDQGLTVAIKKIKLWACQGGAGLAPTAMRLKSALVSCGFTDVKVYGYQLSLSMGLVDGHKAAIVNSSAAVRTAVPARSVRVEF